jgi:hypothetical protein
MNRTHISAAVRTAAAFLASIATTCALLTTVVSLSEPHRSQLAAATASRQMTARAHAALVAQAHPALPTAEITAR